MAQMRPNVDTLAVAVSKASGDAPAPPPAWHPSTAFVAAASLSAALSDVASRTPVPEGTDPGSVPHLAAAARQLHALSFQPYATWLKAAKLPVSPKLERDPSKPKVPEEDKAGAVPTIESLHEDMGDLALWWLLHTESANLRHTPEVLWFLFYCASASDQAAAVLEPRSPDALERHLDGLASLTAPPTAGPHGGKPTSLAQLIRQLHQQHRLEASASASAASPSRIPTTPTKAGAMLARPPLPSPPKPPLVSRLTANPGISLVLTKSPRCRAGSNSLRYLVV
ncbi:hypothetical protein HYH03_002008 [Edaphochlamys debaryana]|uniref:Uncharacterized protein n=1 Tax=Edaphochlamys debaryana TaxID=47281 RepID=A0A836C523_9CHLO|nr:hypothetical protein HYH03_002008 [Edaphochlamys debaryana]|eukprot:KAG2500440.1 hypothetical protein HYH03_002008 [Edaphochlamys debaryana]